MHVALFCEYGEKPEIGMGHLYRLKEISRQLEIKGHIISWVSESEIHPNANVLIIDHVHSQKDLITEAKTNGVKVVLIDGAEEDIELVDTSISAIYNPLAQYKGAEYFAIPKPSHNESYKLDNKSKTVFVAMGGYDANNLAYRIVRILEEMGLPAIVAKSINHTDFKSMFKNVEIFSEDNYYNAMHECLIGITNGGLTLVQALCYGLPTIAIPQYEHQANNIRMFPEGCIKSDIGSVKKHVEMLVTNSYKRESLSRFARNYVDGRGSARICSIIEGLA